MCSEPEFVAVAVVAVAAAAVGGTGCLIVDDYDVDSSVELVVVGACVHKTGQSKAADLLWRLESLNFGSSVVVGSDRPAAAVEGFHTGQKLLSGALAVVVGGLEWDLVFASWMGR